MSTLKTNILDTPSGSGNITVNRPTVLTAGDIITADIADNAVTLAKMAGGTDGQIITYDASGDPVAVGPGTDGQVLTSTGAGSPPAFEAAAGGSVLATAGAYAYRAANQSIATATTTKVAWDTELYDIGGDFDSTTNNRYTVASGEGGKYFVTANLNMNVATDAVMLTCFLYKNGSQLIRAKSATSATTTDQATVGLTCVIELAATDYIEIFANHTKGSNADLQGNVNRNWFIITRLD